MVRPIDHLSAFTGALLRRLPTKPPRPTSSVLSIGPIGVCNVFTAIRAAQAKPTIAPSATAKVPRLGIQFIRADSHAPSQIPKSPPIVPPTNRTRCAMREPTADPTAAPIPAAITSEMNTPAAFMTEGLTNRNHRLRANSARNESQRHRGVRVQGVVGQESHGLSKVETRSA